MATRSSIKKKLKAKLGAAVSLAVGGLAMGSEAGATLHTESSAENSTDALLNAAFKLLEEGQSQILDDKELASDDTPSIQLGAPSLMASAGPDAMGGSFVVSDAGAMGGDIIMAQASAAAGSGAETAAAASSGASGGSAAAAASGGAAGGAAAGGAALGAGATVGAIGVVPVVAPLATALGIGAGVAAVAVVNNSGSDTAGSDLNDDQPQIKALSFSANDIVKLSGKSEAVSTSNNTFTETKVGLIGSTELIDHSFDKFFGA